MFGEWSEGDFNIVIRIRVLLVMDIGIRKVLKI